MADFAAAVRGAAAVSGRSKTIGGTGGTTPTFLRSGVDVRGRPDARGRVDGRDCRRGARRGVAPPGGARGWSGASDQLRNFVRRPRIRQRLRDARLWHQGGPRRGRADVPGQTPDDLLSGSRTKDRYSVSSVARDGPTIFDAALGMFRLRMGESESTSHSQ